VLAADEVLEPRCADCGAAVEFGDSKQIFLKISALEPQLRAYLEAHPYWRRNATAFTKRYLDEGLRDRAITRDIVSKYDPDEIRYFFFANGPEKRDADFSAREFRTQVNSELVGAWGNFVNRTLAFAVKYFDRELPRPDVPEGLRNEINTLYGSVGEKIERGTLQDAIDEIFEAVRRANRYYDAEQPWKTRKEDPEKCRETIGVCAYLILNLAVLLQPFLPFSSEKLLCWLGASDQWKEQFPSINVVSSNYGILFHTIE
jgi:methionyl-tRNA synthetase